MFFVIPGIVLLGIISIAIWGLFFRATFRHERAVREAQRRNADFEKWLATANEPLYCVSCGTMFRGPLESTGCPNCHVRAFVIPVRTSDDPLVATKALQLPSPPEDEGAVASEDVHSTVCLPQPQPQEFLHQGK